MVLVLEDRSPLLDLESEQAMGLAY